MSGLSGYGCMAESLAVGGLWETSRPEKHPSAFIEGVGEALKNGKGRPSGLPFPTFRSLSDSLAGLMEIGLVYTRFGIGEFYVEALSVA